MFQSLINGSVEGLLIGVMALAFTLVYLPTRVFHIALAGIYSAALFAAWELLQRGVPVLGAAVTALAIAAGASLGCEIVNQALLQKSW